MPTAKESLMYISMACLYAAEEFKWLLKVIVQAAGLRRSNKDNVAEGGLPP